MDKNIWDLKNSEKICAIDLDGVCNYYPQCWVDFLNKKLNKMFVTLEEVKAEIPYDIYKKVKQQYRLSGVKENLTINKDAVFLTQKLRKLGWKIVIITARPAQEYPDLARQTYSWLNKNNIAYDLVLFGEKHKHIRVIEQFHNLKFLIDDNSYICNQVSKFGYTSFLLNGDQNKGLTINHGVIRINSLKEILNYIKKQKWQK